VVGRLIHLPPILTVDAIHILGISYVGSDDKARRELGWQPRPLDEGFQATFDAMERRKR
jgi:nucleoside-diphosphate-sugar epimerase